MALIDYIINNKEKYFDNIVEDDIIKKLKQNDSELEVEIVESEIKLIGMIDRMMGGSFGGEIEKTTKVYKNSYYLDTKTNCFYYYDTEEDIIEGQWADVSSDPNWKEYSLHNRVNTEIQGVSNLENIDVSTLLTSMEDRLHTLENEITLLSERTSYLEKERYPVGTVVFGFFPEESYEGYIDPDGSMLKVSEYPALFKLMGYTLGGVGDYFKIFDMRGRVVRALDMGAGIDPGRILGSVQGDMLLAHKHTGETDMSGEHNHEIPLGEAGETGSGGIPSNSYSGVGLTMYTIASAGEHGHTFTTDETGGTENRMKNVALRALLKYKVV